MPGTVILHLLQVHTDCTFSISKYQFLIYNRTTCTCTPNTTSASSRIYLQLRSGLKNSLLPQNTKLNNNAELLRIPFLMAQVSAIQSITL